MTEDGKIWAGSTGEGAHVYLLPKMANRHGLIAGATGTGKTVTLKVLAESFSAMGVPVFAADVKGDLAGLLEPGDDSEDMQQRIRKFGLADAGFSYRGFPCALFDIYGEKGIPLRTTISEMGPVLLSRILGLNDLQSDILTVAFRIADDNQLLLFDTKDLKALLNYISDHRKEYEEDYGRMAPSSLSAILRAVVALEAEGGETFFGEPAFSISDFFRKDADGRGVISILDSESLVNNGRLYSMFLLWLLSELFETLPEVGDLEKPRIVFFFDEAHLLFRDAPKALVEKIEQVVKLVRSKGVGVYFCTQNPSDIPDGVLAQLGNKVEHSLHAYTPSDQKAVRAAADSFRENPAFDTFDVIQNLGVGEAVVSFLDEKGIPGIARKVSILPPESRMAAITDAERESAVKTDDLYIRYAKPVDNPSAYEFLKRRGMEEEAKEQKAQEEEEKKKQEAKEAAALEKQKQKEAAAAAKAAEKEAEKKKKEEEREAEKKEKARKNAVKSAASSVFGTVGREVGKNMGSKFGKFGRTLGGNLGATLGRGIVGTLFHTGR